MFAIIAHRGKRKSCVYWTALQRHRDRHKNIDSVVSVQQVPPVQERKCCSAIVPIPYQASIISRIIHVLACGKANRRSRVYFRGSQVVISKPSVRVYMCFPPVQISTFFAEKMLLSQDRCGLSRVEKGISRQQRVRRAGEIPA